MDLVAPRLCDICEVGLQHRELFYRWGPRRDMCSLCEDKLDRLNKPFCEHCGEAFDGRHLDASFECANCRDRKLWFDFAISAYRTENEVRDLIHLYKFKRRLRLRQTLASMLVDVLISDHRLVDVLANDDAILVPVPLHRKRRSDRGFNQALHLTRLAARELRMPWVNCLRRIRETTPQSQLNRVERLKNLRGAFVVHRPFWRKSEPVRDRTVILIDDVFTTGTTATECAKVLIGDGGARRVVVATVARG